MKSLNFKRLNWPYLVYLQNDHEKILSTIFLHSWKLRRKNNFITDIYLGDLGTLYKEKNNNTGPMIWIMPHLIVAYITIWLESKH